MLKSPIAFLWESSEKTMGSRETLLKSDRLFAVSDTGRSMPAHCRAKDEETRLPKPW